MKVFVTGVSGQLGRDVVNELCSRGIAAVGSDIGDSYTGIQDGSPAVTAPYRKLDITDREAVLRVLSEVKPDAVIHCAAWTAVDAAEEPENREKVLAVNADGPENIALAAKELDIKMLQISTDYVFDGSGERPWEPSDTPADPLGVYGAAKLLGEQRAAAVLEKLFVVRIAWVFGANGKNFVKTMLRVGRTHDSVRVVNDQIGTPTYTFDLAKLLCDMIQTEKYGCYHATNEGGFISWYDFTVEIFRQAGITASVIPVSTEEYGLSRAARPKNSRLSKKKLSECGFTPLPDWKDALSRYLTEIGEK